MCVGDGVGTSTMSVTFLRLTVVNDYLLMTKLKFLFTCDMRNVA